MKRLFCALAISLALHAVLVMVCPLPGTSLPKFAGEQCAVIITLAEEPKSNNSRPKPTANQPSETPPQKTGLDDVHKNHAANETSVSRNNPLTPPKKRTDRSPAPIRRATTPEARPKPEHFSQRDPLQKQPAATTPSATETAPRQQAPSDLKTNPANAASCAEAISDADKNSKEMPASASTVRANRGAAGEGEDAAGSAAIKAVPLYRLNAPPRYPRLARLRGYEGKVLMDVLVGADGSVLDIKIAVSSGYAILDRASLQAVRTWRFEPAYLGSKPIALWVKVPVRFQLK